MTPDRLFCWYLADPANPRLVGEVRLEANARTCILLLDAEEDFDFIPHWSDSVQIPIYVQRLDQAIRIARVLRDRELLENGPVPDRNLWTSYVRHGRRWDLPDCL